MNVTRREKSEGRRGKRADSFGWTDGLTCGVG